MEILDDGIQIETLDLLCVVEPLSHGIGLGGALAQDVQLQLIGPPACVRRGSRYRVFASVARKRALTFAFHVLSDWVPWSLSVFPHINASTWSNPIDLMTDIYRANLSQGALGPARPGTVHGSSWGIL